MHTFWYSYSRMYFKRRSEQKEKGNGYKGEKDMNPQNWNYPVHSGVNSVDCSENTFKQESRGLCEEAHQEGNLI